MYARIGDYFSIPARGIAHGEISHGINKACFAYFKKGQCRPVASPNHMPQEYTSLSTVFTS